MPPVPARSARLQSVVGAALLAALAACGTAVPLKKTDVEAQVPERAALLVVGQTDRATARNQLGEPWLTSDVWAFDLFRSSGRNVHAPVMFVFWWPVPLGVAIDKMTGYVLVRYDGQGVVTTEAHGLARNASVFNGDEVDGSVELAAGDLRFSAGPDGENALLSVDAAAGWPYLEAQPPRGACRVLLGCESWGCEARFAAELRLSRAMPESVSSFHAALLPMDLPPGRHGLRATSLRATIDFATESAFGCAAGETLFAMLALQTERLRLFRQELRATLSVSSERPAGMEERRIVLWQDGVWLVPGTATASAQATANPR